MSAGKRDYLSTFFVISILRGTAKTKLTVLALLWYGEIMKNSSVAFPTSPFPRNLGCRVFEISKTLQEIVWDFIGAIHILGM